MNLTFDTLRSVRSLFYLGFYSECAREAKALAQSADNEAIKEAAIIYSYRAQGALNPAEVARALPSNAPLALQAVKQFCLTVAGDASAKTMAHAALQEWVEDEATKTDSTVQLMAAQAFIDVRDYKSALQLLSGDKENIEKLALTMIAYLSMDRIDLAGQTLKQMADIDDDDPLVQLATIWLGLCSPPSGERAQDAQANLQEFTEKYGPSTTILNLSAAVEIQQKNYSAAFSSLKQARDLSLQQSVKPPQETLINSMVCLQQLNKSREITSKIAAELKQHYPENERDKKLADMEKAFKKSAENYKYNV